MVNLPSNASAAQEAALMHTLEPLAWDKKPFESAAESARLALGLLTGYDSRVLGKLRRAIERLPDRASKQEIQDLARAAIQELQRRQPVENCPLCGSPLSGVGMVLTHRPEDDRRTCFVVVECTGSGHRWQRWADRGGAWEPSNFHDE